MRVPLEYDRKKLYEELWTEPARDVALRYGVSDVELAMVCRKLSVPVPGPSYWARKAAGIRAHRPRLPVRVSPAPKPRPAKGSERRGARPAALNERPTGADPVFPSLPPVATAIPLEALWDLWPPAYRRLRQHGIVMAGQLARMTEEEFLSIPRIGVGALSKVRKALARLTVDAEALPPGAGPGEQSPLQAMDSRRPLIELVQARMTGCSAATLFVAHRRTFADLQGGTLKTLAVELDVTHERVRQLELAVWQRLDSMKGVVRSADDRIARARRGRTQPLTTRDLERMDPWFAGIHAKSGMLCALLEHYEAGHRVIRLGTPEEPTLVPASLASPEQWVARFRRYFDPDTGSRTALKLAVATTLQGEGAPELVHAILTALVVLLPFRPRVGVMLRKLLESSQKPLTVAELRVRIASGFGLDVTPQRIRNEASRLGLVMPRPKTYMLRERLAEWDVHRDCARTAAAQVIRGSTRLQWSASDLLLSLRKRKEPWIKGAGPHVIVHLLRDAPEFRWLGRGLFGLRAAGRRGHKERLSVQQTAVDVLRAAGRNMSWKELYDGLSARRSVAPTLHFSWPIVSLGEDSWGLADRDLGLDLNGISDFARLLNAELDRAGVVGAQTLAAQFRRAWPSASLPSSAVVVRIAAGKSHGKMDSTRTGLIPRTTRSAASAARKTPPLQQGGQSEHPSSGVSASSGAITS